LINLTIKCDQFYRSVKFICFKSDSLLNFIDLEIYWFEAMRIKTAADLANLIKTTRVAQSITQAQLAAAANTGVRFIVDLEKGKPSCALDKCLHVAAMLGIHLFAEVPA